MSLWGGQLARRDSNMTPFSAETAQHGSRRLRGALYLGGGVATIAGLHSLLAGAKSFPPWRPAPPTVESELRFYSGFYIAYGLRVIRAARRPDLDRRELDEIATTLLVAGLGRASAWLTVGEPHPLQRALLAIELLVPPGLLLERARLWRGAS